MPSLPSELRGDLGADFVAAVSDAGSDGRVQIGRVCPELRVHLIGGLARDLGGCPTPSGVDGGYSAVAVIDRSYGARRCQCHVDRPMRAVSG